MKAYFHRHETTLSDVHPSVYGLPVRKLLRKKIVVVVVVLIK